MSEEVSGIETPPEALLQLGHKVGNYRIIRQLGQGGMGAVFEAEHLYIERKAAIKVLHPDLSQNAQYINRFLNELRQENRRRGIADANAQGKRRERLLAGVRAYG